MAVTDGFKTVALGFDKKSVMDYIWAQKQHEAEVVEAWEKKYADLETVVASLQDDNARLHGQLQSGNSAPVDDSYIEDLRNRYEAKISILNSEIESLRSSAAHPAESLAEKDEIINNLQTRLDRATVDMDELTAVNRDLRDELATLEAELNKAQQGNNEEQSAHIIEKDKLIASQQEKINSYLTNITELMNTNKSLEAEISAGEQNLAALKSELEGAKAVSAVEEENARLTARIAALESENAGLSAKLAEAEKASAEAMDDTEKDELIASQQNTIDSYLEELASLTERNRGLQTDIVVSGKTNANLQKENDELRTALANAPKGDEKALAEAAEQISALTVQLGDASANVTILSAKVNSLVSANAALESDKQTLNELIEAVRAENSNLKAKISADTAKENSDDEKIPQMRDAEAQIGEAIMNAMLYADSIIQDAKNKAADINKSTAKELEFSKYKLHDLAEKFTNMGRDMSIDFSSIIKKINALSDNITDVINDLSSGD